MKVLVIDDNANHRKSAEVLLKDYDLTVVASYDEAVELLLPKIDKATKKVTQYPNWDAVLTDLLLPASSNAQGERGRHLVGTPMSLGTTLAFLALSQGVEMVAVVTDANHHDHPASAAFDKFDGVFAAGYARMLCTNQTHDLAPMDLQTLEVFDWDHYGSKAFSSKYPYKEGAQEYEGITRVKNWRKILEKLIYFKR